MISVDSKTVKNIRDGEQNCEKEELQKDTTCMLSGFCNAVASRFLCTKIVDKLGYTLRSMELWMYSRRCFR